MVDGVQRLEEEKEEGVGNTAQELAEPTLQPHVFPA